MIEETKRVDLDIPYDETQLRLKLIIDGAIAKVSYCGRTYLNRYNPVTCQFEVAKMSMIGRFLETGKYGDWEGVDFEDFNLQPYMVQELYKYQVVEPEPVQPQGKLEMPVSEWDKIIELNTEVAADETFGGINVRVLRIPDLAKLLPGTMGSGYSVDIKSLHNDAPILSHFGMNDLMFFDFVKLLSDVVEKYSATYGIAISSKPTKTPRKSKARRTVKSKAMATKKKDHEADEEGGKPD